MSVGRREFIAMTGASLLGLWFEGCRSASNDTKGPVNEVFRDYLARHKLIVPELAELGEEYCRAVPAEADLAKLASLLVLREETARSTTLPKLMEELRTRLEADYRARDLVQLGNWYLCRTEARICAFVALAARRG
jgi:hypothetical protein